MAVYSALLLAALQAAGVTRTARYLATPAWYDGPLRPSLEDIRRVVRQELFDDPTWTAPYGVALGAETLVAAAAA